MPAQRIVCLRLSVASRRNPRGGRAPRSGPAALLSAPLFVAILCAGAALAQTTAPATPTVTPAPNCEKPGEPPAMQTSELGKASAETRRSKWQSASKAYFDCLKRFIDEQQQQAALHGKAANAAVDEYNRAIKSYNDYIEAAKQAQQ